MKSLLKWESNIGKLSEILSGFILFDHHLKQLKVKFLFILIKNIKNKKFMQDVFDVFLQF